MKLRPRITLWIAGVALLAGVGFSGYVVYRLSEEPYHFIDNELRRMAGALASQADVAPERLPETIVEAVLPFPAEQYWLRLSDRQGRTLFQTTLASLTEIPPGVSAIPYNIERVIPRQRMAVGQDADDEVLFRVLTIRSEQGAWSSLVIAKPIEDLEIGLQDLLLEMGAALALFILLVVAVSYFLAGRILQPLVDINRMARQITESSLDQRINLDHNQDELHDLALSLNLMFDRLQYSFTRQKEFIGNAAHELKSPITLLLLAHEELVQDPRLEARVRTTLSRQSDTLRRMSRLVKNLLDLSRLEQQARLQRRLVDLRKLLVMVLQEYEPMFQSSGVRVTNLLEEALVVSGDEEMLQRLFINLLDNAWRYNLARDGEIRISGAKAPGEVTVVLANTGPGVPAGEAELVFEQFYRVEKSRSPSGGGSGLGLTIARTIARLHGGTVALHSAPDGWTMVTVNLPVVPPE